jgi:hypothetical protein
MKHLVLIAASLLAPAAFPSSAAETSDSALRTCRAVADKTARLACYDALPLAAATAAPAAPAAAPASSVAPSAVVAAAAAAAPAAAPAVVPAAPAKASETNFGLEAQRAAETQQIASRITGIFEGWSANSRITLANGQVWQVIDGTSASYYLKDPKVTIARAAMGSFRLEIDGARQAPRVKRVE